MKVVLVRTVGLAAVAALFCHAPLGAQGRPLVPTGTQNLGYGNVIPGLSTQVLRSDPVGSGQFTLRGEKNAQVQLQFVLPASMSGPLGATIPLTFGASDGGFSATESITNQVGFDPRASALGRLSNNGRATVFLGGTANPGPAQRSGSYTGTITLTVSYTGL
jgi:hypothetical protein